VRLGLDSGRPTVEADDGATTSYDLLVVAGGINSDTPALLERMGIGYRRPVVASTFIREYFLGKEALDRSLGTSMHVFLLDVPGLEFAAIIPKGEYATVCLLGEGVNKKLAEAFMNHPAVRACFPAGVDLPQRSCQCAPYIAVRGGRPTFADRTLVLGDCGVTRLYKDGIGAAYRTAKAAAAAAVFHGVSAGSFRRHFAPVVRTIERDNALGRLVFLVTRLIQKVAFARRGVLRMTAAEQSRAGARRRMSQVLWDVFTGSAPYRIVLVRTLHPAFLGRLAASLAASVLPGGRRDRAAP
jgi:hypothetical protein